MSTISRCVTERCERELRIMLLSRRSEQLQSMKKHNLHAENNDEPKSAVSSAGQVKHTRSLSFHLLIPRLGIDHLVE